MPRRAWSGGYRLYPSGHESGSADWLYAFGEASGVVKIGHTHRPRVRMAAHWGRHRGQLAWTHLFPPACCSQRARAIETEACKRLAEIGRLIDGGTERFEGVTKGEALFAVRAAIARWSPIGCMCCARRSGAALVRAA
jgi:hypothetical protein